MSHELRTPLNAIIGFTELLQEDATPDQQPDLARVGGAGRHLLALIDDVLDVSRVEAGRLDVSLGRVDARAILADVLAVLAPALDARGVAVTVDASPAWVSADHTRLRQVLTNLLSNACKFAESEIVVRVASEARQVVIHVDDDGAGVDPAFVARLFQPFARQRDDVPGTGLGLALSHSLMAHMGGTLDHAPLPRGARFSVRLRSWPDPP